MNGLRILKYNILILITIHFNLYSQTTGRVVYQERNGLPVKKCRVIALDSDTNMLCETSTTFSGEFNLECDSSKLSFIKIIYTIYKEIFFIAPKNKNKWNLKIQFDYSITREGQVVNYNNVAEFRKNKYAVFLDLSNSGFTDRIFCKIRKIRRKSGMAIFLENNNIVEIPKWIIRRNNIELIDLTGNPLSESSKLKLLKMNKCVVIFDK